MLHLDVLLVLKIDNSRIRMNFGHCHEFHLLDVNNFIRGFNGVGYVHWILYNSFNYISTARLKLNADDLQSLYINSITTDMPCMGNDF